jgi:hypothetical protein
MFLSDAESRLGEDLPAMRHAPNLMPRRNRHILKPDGRFPIVSGPFGQPVFDPFQREHTTSESMFSKLDHTLLVGGLACEENGKHRLVVAGPLALLRGQYRGRLE